MHGRAPRRVPMRRQFRLVTTAFLLAASLIAIQKAPRAAAFTWPDYCGTTYACATWTFNFTGAGSAHGYDDQGGLDCYYNGSQPSGTCTYLYYWIAQMYPNGQLPVTRTVAPSANSYLCGFDGSSCKEPGSSSTATLDLSANEIVTSDFQVNLAKVQTTTVAKNSDGSGKIISSPSGLNCTVTSGVNSGTCTATFYFRDSLTVTYTATPVSDSLACVNSITNCAAVGEPNHSAVTYTFSGTGGTLLFFLQAHPILTVGVTGQGTVVSSPSGISCPSTCHKYFAPDTNVTLNAAAKSGYMFSGWTG